MESHIKHLLVVISYYTIPLFRITQIPVNIALWCLIFTAVSN